MRFSAVQTFLQEYKMKETRKGLKPMVERDERPLMINTQVALVDPTDELRSFYIIMM